LTTALVTISTGNWGGKLGYIGIAVPETRYLVLSTGPKLDQPIHPGAYPATTSDDKKICEKEVVEADGFELTGPSSKTVSTANGRIMRATMTALPPLTQLRAGARKAIVIPELKQALISIEQLADQGYTTIFHPHHEGVTVHDNDGFKLVTSKPPLLQE